MARENEDGAEFGKVGDGRLAGNLKSGRGRGPGELSLGEEPSDRPGLARGKKSTAGDVAIEVIVPTPPRDLKNGYWVHDWLIKRIRRL